MENILWMLKRGTIKDVEFTEGSLTIIISYEYSEGAFIDSNSAQRQFFDAFGIDILDGQLEEQIKKLVIGGKIEYEKDYIGNITLFNVIEKSEPKLKTDEFFDEANGDRTRG